MYPRFIGVLRNLHVSYTSKDCFRILFTEIVLEIGLDSLPVRTIPEVDIKPICSLIFENIFFNIDGFFFIEQFLKNISA